MHKNKINILFICPYPVAQSPSQRFRFEQYFEIMQTKGFSIEVRSFLTLAVWEILYKSGNSGRKIIGVLSGFISRFKQLFTVSKFDFIFIHREATPIGPPWFEWAVANLFRKKIIYDFDDAIWLPDANEKNKLVSILKWQKKVSSICKWSYAVSCGNEYLCTFARQFNHNVFLNPTTVDTEKLHNPDLYPLKKKSDRITIGWTGTHSTLKYIDPILPVIQALDKKFPDQLRLMVIADKKPSVMTSLYFVPWSKETEIQDLLQFDIGIMPLTDDMWAYGKCGFKILQYMSLGIPSLASPVGVNATIIEDGKNGFLCDSLAKWGERIEGLMHDKNLRHQLGICGRERVVRYYSVASNLSNFLSLFE